MRVLEADFAFLWWIGLYALAVIGALVLITAWVWIGELLSARAERREIADQLREIDELPSREPRRVLW
jgi:hypothetical protein